jgi:hypothetical protein
MGFHLDKKYPYYFFLNTLFHEYSSHLGYLGGADNSSNDDMGDYILRETLKCKAAMEDNNSNAAKKPRPSPSSAASKSAKPDSTAQAATTEQATTTVTEPD